LRGTDLRAIALDALGNAFVTGERDREDVRTCHDCPPAQYGPDVLIAKIDTTELAMIYTTYVSAGHFTISNGNAIAIDGQGNAYVAGVSVRGFPTTPGAYQSTIPAGVPGAFVLKVNPTGSQ